MTGNVDPKGDTFGEFLSGPMPRKKHVITRDAARRVAREFHREIIRTMRPWDAGTLEDYLPRDFRFHRGANYCGPCTIGDLAAFIMREAVRIHD